MSDITETPEFKEELKKACEEEWKGWLYGDKKKARAAEKLPESVREALKESEQVKRRAESMRRRAESQMHGARGSGMFSLPAMPVLPENPTREDFDKYRTETDAYREKIQVQSQSLNDSAFQEALKNYSNKSGWENSGGLRCPECGDIDHNNRMGKTPWCIKCNCALESSNKKTKKKQMRIKFKGKQKLEPRSRIYRDLPEDHIPFTLSREEQEKWRIALQKETDEYKLNTFAIGMFDGHLRQELTLMGIKTEKELEKMNEVDVFREWYSLPECQRKWPEMKEQASKSKKNHENHFNRWLSDTENPTVSNGVAHGTFGQPVTGICEICGTDKNLEFHAGQLCLQLFKKESIRICEECWKKKNSES